jgi:hypothetical protein
MLAEAVKAVGGKKDEVKKKKPIPVARVDVESEEDFNADGSDDEPRRGCNYGAFKRCNPPSFDGTKEASAVQQWLREIEAVLCISECREEQKVKFASHLFVSEVLCWWDNIRTDMGARAVDRMGWKEFKQLVTDQYCPTSELSSLEKKFVNLEAGGMTHQEYTTKFNRMA